MVCVQTYSDDPTGLAAVSNPADRSAMIAKSAATLFFLVAISHVTFAQSGAFTGEVVDSATDAPLSKLRVYLLDDKDQIVASTITDERGKFNIPLGNHGIFHLRFDRLGMKSVFGPVDTIATDRVTDRTYKASLMPIPFDSVFYESQVDVPAEMSPDFQGAPHYPRSLERSGMRGSVSLTFVVDTTGHAEMGSVKTIHSSGGAFLKAVMDELPRMAFTPARVTGRKVRQLVKQRFDFNAPISR